MLLNKEYRDGYLDTHVRTGIAYQLRAMRSKKRLSQGGFAAILGKKQSTVSRLENVDYGRMSVQTLLEIASATDVALLVRFVDYAQFLEITGDMSESALAPATIHETVSTNAERSSNNAIMVQTWASAINSSTLSIPALVGTGGMSEIRVMQ